MTNETSIDKPIGVLGGTFNPIHHAHLRLALELYERLDLAEVRLIPSAQPPHRIAPTVSSQLRFEMVQAAIADVEGLNVDDRELRRTGLSYMVDTLSSLREDYSNRPLCLILGMDAFMGLPQWYQWKRLISLAHLLVVHRPGILLPDKHLMQDFLKAHRANSAADLRNKIAGAVWIEEIPTFSISATQIRGLIAAGKNPHYLLPLTVLDIINSHQLYH
jgi:nicotinate-nucleotide adenylyltransferase